MERPANAARIKQLGQAAIEIPGKISVGSRILNEKTLKEKRWRLAKLYVNFHLMDASRSEFHGYC